MASIPDPVLDKLRCYMCENFLSYPPISITAQGESLCGRCKPNKPVIRARAYECVADYFLFPCKNWEKHCAFLLNVKDVMQHEKDCSFSGACSIFCFKPSALCKPDNKLDLSQTLRFYNIPEQEVQAALTCTLCGYYLSSCPIFVSPESYSICHRCYEIKGGQIPRNYVRHYALEYISEILLFPCVYRKRGCTKVFRFGYDSDHEQTCSYSRTQKPLSTFTDPNNGKKRGVYKTHTGHMFGTITPNSPQFFGLQNNMMVTDAKYKGIEPIKMVPSETQGRFITELIKHRQSLQYQWNRNSKIEDYSPIKLVEEGSEIKFEEPNEKPNNRSGLKPEVERQNSYNSEPSPGWMFKDEGFSDYPSITRLSPLQDNTNESDLRNNNRTGGISPNRQLLHNSSGSDTVNSRASTSGSINTQPTGPRSPLKLNANDLLHSNSFNYAERVDRLSYDDGNDSFLSNLDNRSYLPRIQ